ncbi:MAG: peptidoglycan DD-metalloendopeptidase family protein [Acidobacteria bacterium]|nr:peptidoglycan DD-metalloendopeptidase family protein [Acidobacteriota bacterium]
MRTRAWLRASTFVVLALTAVSTTAVSAATADEPRGKVEILTELREKYDEAVALEGEVLAQYEFSLSEQVRLEGEIDETVVAIAVAEKTLERQRAGANQAEALVLMVSQEIGERQGQLAAEKFRLRRQSVSAYILGEDLELSAILGATNAAEALAVGQYSSAVLEAQTATIDEIDKIESEIDAMQAHTERVQAKAQRTREHAARAARALERQRQDLAGLNFVVAIEVRIQEALLTKIRADQDEYLRRLNALESDSDGVTSVLNDWQVEQETEPVPVLMPPVDQFSYSSGFGTRVHPIFGDVRMHNGLDVAGSEGTPIRAAADGIVVMAMLREGFGNVVVIDHGGRSATVYAHQVEFAVEFGQEVVAGEIIGYVGSTGYSTGPHLHFEVRSYGQAIDPVPQIDPTLKVSCEWLEESDHPADVELLLVREDCHTVLTSD